MIVTIVLLITIYALNILDYVQTAYAVELFGIGVEANPVARFLFENNCAWVPKLIVVPILLTIIGAIIKFDKRQVWVVYVLLAFYIAVIVNNFIALMRMGALSSMVMCFIISGAFALICVGSLLITLKIRRR